MQARARGLPPALLLGLLEKRERRASLRNEGLEAFLRLLQACQDEPGVRQLVYLALGDALKAVQGADGAGRGASSGSQAPNSDLYICICAQVHVHVHVREALTACCHSWGAQLYSPLTP